MDLDQIESLIEYAKHRFLGYFRRIIEGEPTYIYRCICGYIEAAPVHGGPSRTLSSSFSPQPDARRQAAHLHLERAHELN